MEDLKNVNKAAAALTLGAISLFTWMIPVLGLPIALYALLSGRKGRQSEIRRIALAGMIMASVSLVLNTAVIGAAGYTAYNWKQIKHTWEYNNSDYGLCSKMLGITVPESAKLLKSHDTHGGFLGDGDYLAVFSLDKEQAEKLVDQINRNKKWNRLPITKDLNVFLFGYEKITKDSYIAYEGSAKEIPSNIKNGYNYFEDVFAGQNPVFKGGPNPYTSITTGNFIFSVLDLDSGKLYVKRYDS